MIGSRFQRPPSGMGIIPLIIAAATIGAGIYQQKQAEKAAAKQAEEAAKLNRRPVAAPQSAVRPWMLWTAGAAVVGAGAWMLSRRRR